MWRDTRFPDTLLSQHRFLTACVFVSRNYHRAPQSSSQSLSFSFSFSLSLSLFFFRRRSVSCVQGVSIDLLVICTLVECCCMCWLSIFCTGEQYIYIYIYIVWRIIKKMLRIVYRFKQPPLDQTIERISRRGDLCSCERSLPSGGEKLAFGHPHDRFFFSTYFEIFPETLFKLVRSFSKNSRKIDRK